MPTGCAAKVELGNRKAGVFGRGDLVHLQGGVERVLGCAADKGDDGGGGRHGEGAQAGGLGDGAVADVGVAVFGAEAGKVEADRLGQGAVNQRSPSPLTRMPNSVPLRAIVVTSVLPSTPWAASAIALQAAMTGLSTLRALSPRA